MFSNSRIQCYKSCRRMYEWKYLHNVVPVETASALRTGSSYHDKIRQINTNGNFERDGDAKTNAMAEAYKRFVLPEIKALGYKIAEAEKYFEMEIDGNGVCGIIDAVCDDGTPVEFKSTSSNPYSSEYVSRIEHDEQVKMYMLATGKTHIVYAVLQTPTIRQKNGETDDEYEQRCIEWYDQTKAFVFEHVTTKEKLDQFESELSATMHEIDGCKLFYANPNNCMKFGRLCEYAQICETKFDPDAEYVGFERRKDRNGEAVDVAT